MIVAELSGGPFERGHKQGSVAPHLHDHVRRWVGTRVDRADVAPRNVRTKQAARDLAAFAEKHCPDSIAEARGISQVFALSPDGVLKGWQTAAYAPAGAGCSLVAWSDGRNALLAKTRDVPADTLPIRSVFRQRSADFRAGAILSPSPLASTAAASSGVNAAGLALADAAVPTRDHGLGILRYLLMQRLLERCRTVREAIDEIRDTSNAGGGSLLLVDADGNIAVIETGRRKIGIELKSQGVIARTNHNLDAALAPAESGQNSRKRLSRMEEAMARAEVASTSEAVASLMSVHGEGAVCRHSTPSSDIETISLAILVPARRTL